MAKVSIIVPAYNVGQYIDECIESIVNQTYDDWEAIIVIDGATDDTELRAREWEGKCEKVKVVTQENQGSGPARNAGIDNASGEYLMFVDPDDWIDKEMLSMYMECENIIEGGYDLVVSDCVTDYYDGDRCVNSEKESINGFESFELQNVRESYLKLFVKGLIRGPVCKLYKSSIVKENNIRFPALKRSQDIVFNYRYFSFIRTLKVFDSHYYHYRCMMDKAAGKLYPDYYKIVSQIYSEIMVMHKSWNIKPSGLYYEKFCEYLFHSLISLMLAGEARTVMDDIVDDDGLRRLVANAKAETWKKQLIRMLILWKQPKMINALVYLNQMLVK